MPAQLVVPVTHTPTVCTDLIHHLDLSQSVSQSVSESVSQWVRLWLSHHHDLNPICGPATAWRRHQMPAQLVVPVTHTPTVCTHLIHHLDLSQSVSESVSESVSQ